MELSGWSQSRRMCVIHKFVQNRACFENPWTNKLDILTCFVAVCVFPQSDRLFPCDQIQVMHFWQEYHITNVGSFSINIRRHMRSICSVKLEFEVARLTILGTCANEPKAREGSILCQLSVSAQLSRGNRTDVLLWEQGEIFQESRGSSGALYIQQCPAQW